jgi:alkylation response protein AidB-like acyl-CoA dehydrogenase
VRAFLDEALVDMPADRRARSWLGFDAAFSHELGRRGWIGLALPAEAAPDGCTGALCRGRGVARARRAVSAHWIAERQSAPMILRYGSEAQKRLHIRASAVANRFSPSA